MNNVTSTPRPCDLCGNLFLPGGNFAKRCVACCTFPCRQCGKSFFSRRRRALAFCSLDCTNDWQRDAVGRKSQSAKAFATRGTGTIQPCATCKEPFYVPRWRVKWNTKYCSNACRDYKADMKGINRVLRFPAKRDANKLEHAGRVILGGLAVEFVEQHLIGGKFVVDAFLPTSRTVIQWDGDFWHANPARYPSGLHAIQQTNVNRDRACNAYLAKCGYRVLRFWESDVHSRPSWVAAEIQRAI